MKTAEQIIEEGDEGLAAESLESTEAEGAEPEDGAGEEPADAGSEGEAEPEEEPEGEPEEEQPPPAARRSQSRKRTTSKAREQEPDFARDSSREADEDVRSWIRSLGLKTPLKIELVRKYPKRHRGKPIEGTIETFDEPIDEDDIRDLHGGGTYVLRIKTPDAKGRYVYKTQRQIKIAGGPKTKHLDHGDDEDDSRKGDPVADRMMRLIEDQIADGKKGSTDTYAMLQAAMAPMNEQNAALREELRELRSAVERKDSQILQLMTKEPDTSRQDKLLELTLTNKDRDVNELRARYEDEIRKTREDHRAEMQRERERHADEIKELRRDAARQVEMAQKFSEQHASVSKTSYDGQIAGLNRTIAEKDELIRQLRDEIKDLRAEMKTLQEKKDKGALDQLQEVARIKETFGELGFLGGDDEEKKGALDRLLAAGEPIIGRILEAQRPQQAAAQGGAAPAALPAAPQGEQSAPGGVIQLPADTPADQLPPENVPIKLPDGSRYVRVGMQLRPYDPGEVRRRRAAAAASGRGGQAAPARPKRQIDESEIRKAATYLEQALENGHDPHTVANSVRGVIAGDLLDYIRDEGIDDLLKSARLDIGSPLKTQRGKEFVREIGRILVEG